MRLEVLANQLILALGLVHGELAACDHAQAVGRLELQVAQRRAEHEAAELRCRVLEREVQVPRIPDAAVGQLAFDPHFEESLFERIPQGDRELGDGQHSPLNGPRLGRRYGLVFEGQVEKARHEELRIRN